MGKSKVLKVSYDTFACELEGFDNPFPLMRDVIEFFSERTDDPEFSISPSAEAIDALATRLSASAGTTKLEAVRTGRGVRIRRLAPVLTPTLGAGTGGNIFTTALPTIPEPTARPSDPNDGGAVTPSQLRAASAEAEKEDSEAATDTHEDPLAAMDQGPAPEVEASDPSSPEPSLEPQDDEPVAVDTPDPTDAPAAVTEASEAGSEGAGAARDVLGRLAAASRSRAALRLGGEEALPADVGRPEAEATDDDQSGDADPEGAPVENVAGDGEPALPSADQGDADTPLLSNAEASDAATESAPPSEGNAAGGSEPSTPSSEADPAPDPLISAGPDTLSEAVEGALPDPADAGDTLEPNTADEPTEASDYPPTAGDAAERDLDGAEAEGTVENDGPAGAETEDAREGGTAEGDEPAAAAQENLDTEIDALLTAPVEPEQPAPPGEEPASSGGDEPSEPTQRGRAIRVRRARPRDRNPLFDLLKADQDASPADAAPETSPPADGAPGAPPTTEPMQLTTPVSEGPDEPIKPAQAEATRPSADAREDAAGPLGGDTSFPGMSPMHAQASPKRETPSRVAEADDVAGGLGRAARVAARLTATSAQTTEGDAESAAPIPPVKPTGALAPDETMGQKTAETVVPSAPAEPPSGVQAAAGSARSTEETPEEAEHASPQEDDLPGGGSAGGDQAKAQPSSLLYLGGMVSEVDEIVLRHDPHRDASPVTQTKPAERAPVEPLRLTTPLGGQDEAGYAPPSETAPPPPQETAGAPPERGETFIDRIRRKSQQPDETPTPALEAAPPDAPPQSAGEVPEATPDEAEAAMRRGLGTSPKRGFDGFRVRTLVGRLGGRSSAPETEVPPAPALAPSPPQRPTEPAERPTRTAPRTILPTTIRGRSSPPPEPSDGTGGARKPAASAGEDNEIASKLRASFETTPDMTRATTGLDFGDAPEEADGRLTPVGFAKRMGTNTLLELMEASAAYTVLIDGRATFSRGAIMTMVDQIGRGGAFSAEARIKSFGKLMRSGRFVRLDDGQFVLSDAARAEYAIRLADLQLQS
ncbi:MAG: hypothetical protein AAGA32_04000 [Pseudomonadota bacterium]